jgi:hypothetical protein
MKHVIKLELSAKRKKALLINDMVPAFILVFTGITTLQESAGIALGFVNVLFGGAMIAAGVREWRSLRAPSHHRIQWYDIISGSVMMLDAVTMYKPWKGFQPAWFYAAASLLVILKGFSVFKPVGIRRLTLTDDGFTVRTGLFSSLHCRWDEIDRIAIVGNRLIVYTQSGERSLSFSKITNHGEVLAVLNEKINTGTLS